MKISNIIKSSIGIVSLCLLMFVNVQIGLNDGDEADLNILGLEATVFTPTAAATGSCTTKWAEYRNWLGNCAGDLNSVCEQSGTGC